MKYRVSWSVVLVALIYLIYPVPNSSGAKHGTVTGLRSALGAGLLVPSAGQSGTQTGDSGARSVAMALPAAPALDFIRNDGQVYASDGSRATSVLYYAESGGARVYFSRDGIHFVLPVPGVPAANAGDLRRGGASPGMPVAPAGLRRIDMLFDGAHPGLRVEAAEVRTVRRNYYTAREAAGITGVPSFGVITYRDVYPGIDLVFRAEAAGIKYEYHVAPGADPARIGLHFAGGEQLDLHDDGTASVSDAGRVVLRDGAPVVYTRSNGVASPVSVTRVARAHGFGFVLGAYDTRDTLVIDPFLQWASYYGGASSDYLTAVAIDASNNTVCAGYTMSTDFPVKPGSFQSENAGNLDLFIAGLDSDRNIRWATYYGGTAEETQPHIAFDSFGAFVLAATTSSADFPLTPGAYQPVNNGKSDIALVKFSGEGARLWATYFGGGLSDECSGIALDKAGNIVLAGGTFSTNFPVTRNAFQTTNKGDFDLFLARFSAVGARTWATYIGGWGMDYANTVALDPSDNILLAGHTESQNFPVTTPSAQATYGGGPFDMFLLKFSPEGARIWGTYLGGTREDRAARITCDKGGRIILSGYSGSTNLPASPNASQRTSGGDFDGVLAEFDGKGTLAWLTYLGGKGLDIVDDHCVDPQGRIVIAGHTESNNFPVTPDAFQRKRAGAYDAFFTRLNSAGGLVFSTYFGGKDQEIPHAAASERGGNILLAGITASPDFPVRNPAQKKRAGFTDVFFVRIIFDEPVANAGRDTIVCIGSGAVIGGPASGGRAPYSYAWKPATGLSADNVQSPSAAPRKTTVYEVTVTDAEGAWSNDSVVVTVKALPRISAGRDVSICRGSSTQIGGTPQGGQSPFWYTWSPATGLSTTDAATPTASPLETTTYTVTVRDFNGCIATDSVTVTVYPPIVINAGPDVAVCPSAETPIGAVATGGQPPYSYSWSPAAGLSSAKIAQPSAHPDSTTKYVVTVTDAKGCRETDTVLVRVMQRLLILAGPDHAICPGETVRLAADPAQGRAPFTYAWSPAAGLSTTNTLQPVASPDETTTYVLTVTDANGCTGRDSVKVTVNQSVRAAAGPDVTICEGTGTEIGAAATGGLPPYTYLWSPPKGLTGAQTATPTAAPSSTTRYIVTVRDALGCTGRDTVLVAVASVPRVKADADFSLCRGSRRKVAASVRGGTAPFRWQWEPRRGLSAYDMPTPIANPDSSTVYVVSVTDANGCTARDTIVILVRPCSKADAGPDMESCEGSPVTLGGEAADRTEEPRYEWTPVEGLSAPSRHHTEAAPKFTTTYTLRVTNMYGCESFDTVTVVVHPRPAVGAGPPLVMCDGESRTIGGEASGGQPPYSYMWEPAIGLSDARSARPSVSPSTSVLYRLTVTDARGCVARDTVQVTVHPVPVADAGADRTLCAGESAVLGAASSGGRGPFRYEWRPSAGLSDAAAARPRATPDASTTYILTVTNKDGCTAVDSTRVHVNPRPTPSIEASAPLALCEGQPLTLDAGPGFAEYRWSDGRSTRSIDVTRSGSYAVSVRSAEGCTADAAPVSVTFSPVPRALVTPRGPVQICEGETAVLDAGTGFTAYRWSNGAVTRTVAVRANAVLAVTVANAAGCEAVSDSVVVRVLPMPVVSIERRSDTLIGSVADAYQWQRNGAQIRGAVNREFIARAPGTYSIRVSNKAGCAVESRPVEVVFGSAVATVTGGTVRKGDTAALVLRLMSEKNLAASGVTGFEAAIRVKKKVCEPLDPSTVLGTESRDLVMRVQGAWRPGDRVLASIPVHIVAERAGPQRLEIESFRWTGGPATAETRDGVLRIR
ncbi:MAG: hypothetical protein HY962_08545 [Ignavibacteriae bacterium]|nr:hypothetical protein [Ignavibacteriota bacterium]